MTAPPWSTAGAQVWRPTVFVACRDDRLFPVAWLRTVVADRLGEPVEIPGGSCAYLSPPEALAGAILERTARIVGTP